MEDLVWLRWWLTNTGKSNSRCYYARAVGGPEQEARDHKDRLNNFDADWDIISTSQGEIMEEIAAKIGMLATCEIPRPTEVMAS